ncbi:carboxymuconolactone decarboxylase family protein [Paludibaculum fermentans]|uniref:Alkyl hydroperoxide reductase AhpD n=1 Tax=Paludibaculum fermentans TaxID=1473598 RepID=A0A7S7SNJ8_PALFE|nr:carboxymuconolactone decarboxylase family protein [Paludibaculum fermentans]QOY90636.1 carboxymuconolactone decarboxylase family protein [Paludibaculum fermentans]
MTIPEILDAFPDYARDIKLNVQSVLAQSELTEQQTWTNAVACALASRNETLSQAILAEAATKLSPAQLSSAKAAFAIMQMNNIFYRFRHMVGKDDYANIPARLRMQSIRTHGGDPVDFELACLAVSTINGCEACVRSHEAVVREKGVSAEAVVASVRIASTLHAAASVIEAPLS